MQNKKEDKVSMLQIIKNNCYIFRYAIKLDPVLVGVLILTHVLVALSWTYASSLFLKHVIESFQNQKMDVYDTLWVIVRGSGIIILNDLLEKGSDFFFYPRFTYAAGKIQREMLEKATSMDLICYDNTEYYDDFVIAAKQAENMIIEGVLVSSGLIGLLVGMLFLGGFMFTLKPVLMVFPIVGFVINTVMVSKVTSMNYEYEMERRRIMRKADYSKRVFYQPEYAKEIKLTHIEVPLKRQFDEAIDEAVKEAEKIGRKIAVVNLIDWITVYTLLCYCFPPIYLGYLALVRHTIHLGEVASLNSAQEAFRDSLNAVNYNLVEFQRVGQYGEKFRRFMDYQVHTEGQPGIGLTAKEPKTIEIKDMSFRYEGADKDTLRHINMTIKPGQKIALVGENGAGKTTFVKLLMRLYDVTEGVIQYDGKDIREYETQSYRKIFGTVFQDFQLYAGSIAENVLMDNRENGLEKGEDEEIRRALDYADFSGKLKKLKDSIQTQLTREFQEDGTMLSGGESQKVAIARLFVKKENMMVAILDEPSSALDPRAEFVLNKNMMEKSKNATVIFISHRLSTTRDADCIYMFEHGEIVERGTHDELMKCNGGYAKMFEKQALYYREE